MEIYNVIKILENQGYKFNFKAGSGVNIKLKEGYNPEPDQVKPLFEKLKKNKAKVVRILKNREMLNPIPDWFIIKSDLLDGEKVLIKKNGSIKTPYKHRELESYTLLEAQELLEDGITSEELKVLHTVKREFEGTLIRVDPEVIKKITPVAAGAERKKYKNEL